jgi:glyoxylase-like metal-dependent hydrolase (beta-lactamase superfamily II)
MQIELIPSSLPPSDLQFLVSFVINDSVAVDAGAIGLLADLQRQQAIRHVFITHEHLDHIATLPIFLENGINAAASGAAPKSLTLHWSLSPIPPPLR